jgi:hypothetical protein
MSMKLRAGAPSFLLGTGAADLSLPFQKLADYI